LNAEPQITGKIFRATGANLVVRDRLALDELREQMIVELGDSLDHFLAVFLGLLDQVRGNLHDVELRAQRFVMPQDGVHLHQVDNALELVFGAHGDLNGNRLALQTLDDGLHRMEEIRADAVHLVNETDARDVVFIGLPPHRLRLRLHSGDGVEHRHRAIQHAQAALHLGGKIHVAGRIDDVDLDVLPLASGGGRGNGDAPLLLLLHPIHDGGALMDLAQLVRAPGVIKDSLGRSGLTCIDMSRDADIPHPVERYQSCHK
jgi:hypothetical protein